MRANEATAELGGEKHIVRNSLYYGGEWRAPAESATIDVEAAYSGKVIGTVPRANQSDMAAAVACAGRAAKAWRVSRPQDRARYLNAIADGIEGRADEIARIISAEVGTPFKISQRVQVGSPIAIFRYYARLAETFKFEDQVGNSLVIRDPIGVVGCITPWNYPLHQIAAKVAAALAAGCVVVLKPSEVAPLNAFALAEIIHEVGLPPGVFNLVSGFGREVGESLVTDLGVDMVSFTGSTATGAKILELSARSIKRVSVELGGKSAAIILDDADLKVAVKATVSNCFLNSGQTCSAHTRMLVPRNLLAEATQLAVEAAASFKAGDPFDPNVRIGPLVSQRQLEIVRSFIERGQHEGAELVCGGLAVVDGRRLVQPTVFTNVKASHRIAQEEIFGPVLSIMPYETEDEAIEIANGTKYGLAGGVWSASIPRALGIARRMHTGQVDINGGPFNLAAPFGGVKQSGNGRELGQAGLEEFLELKAIQFRPDVEIESVSGN